MLSDRLLVLYSHLAAQQNVIPPIPPTYVAQTIRALLIATMNPVAKGLVIQSPMRAASLVSVQRVI